MTAERFKANGPVFCHFRELAHLPPEERHTALMERLEHTWALAEARSYTSAKGNVHHMPDTAVMLKVIQAVAVLHQMAGPASEAEAAALSRMTDADLVREATKRLPPSQVAELADALIAQREAERDGQAIVAKAESIPHDQTKRRKRARDRNVGSERGGGGGLATAPEGDSPSPPDADPKWT